MKLWSDGSQSIVWGPAVPAAPGNLLEKQIPRPHQDLLSQNFGGWGPTNGSLIGPLGGLCAHGSLRTTTAE